MLKKSKEFNSTTEDLLFFLRVASSGSLTATAKELGLSLPAVSKRLAQLELRLGVQLISRTTRRLELTSEGRVYFEGARPILNQLADLESAVCLNTGRLKGSLQVNAPFGFGRRHVAPLVSAFATLHQELDISLQLTNQSSNFLDANIDVDIRMGAVPDSRLIARKILANPRVICCSPAYIDNFRAPSDIQDLVNHNCIILRQYESDYGIWRFTKQSQLINQKVKGRFSTNDGEVAMRAALDGHGLIMRSWWDAKKYIHSGELVQVLKDYSLPDGDVYAVYQYRKFIPGRIAVFVEYLQENLGKV
ncbi:LysR family transcriptional regulator [Acerihabitans arboris]|uniref:LysR family transcriptional regulator n=1 Tax=Acerihabitans arboris TaxID=2691583 RepID=A0A845S9R1_9GAMM|nr:LysR family transcriptional regulator [Acerihabitans arboris]NDL61493.1 LysR family transcriptional regulator [Acerihabitans arboris]